MAEVIGELVKVLPENDWLRFALLVFFILLLVLRGTLFTGIRDISCYLFRWAKCQALGKHTYMRRAGMVDMSSLSGDFYYSCTICGKTTVGRGVL